MARLGRVPLGICAIVVALSSCSKTPPPPPPQLTRIEVGDITFQARIPAGRFVSGSGGKAFVGSVDPKTGERRGDVDLRDLGPVPPAGKSDASELARIVDANWRRSHDFGQYSQMISRKQLTIDSRPAEEIVAARQGVRSRHLFVVDQDHLLSISMPEGYESSTSVYEAIRASLVFP